MAGVPALDTILHGDCVDILNTLPENSVDMIFADPPYNLQLRQELWRPNMTKVDAVDDDWDQFGGFAAYDHFTRRWLSACQRVLKDTGTLWVIGSYHNIYRVGAILQDLGYWILNDVVWIKCLSEYTYLHVKTARGERPMTIKDMVRLDPASVQLWNGKKWVQALGWEQQVSPDGCMDIVLRSGERIRCSQNHHWPTARGEVEASALQIGDILHSCALPEPEACHFPANLEDELIGWLVGIYLAEGSRSEDTIRIASHVTETERLTRLADIARAYHGTMDIHQTRNNGCTANLNGKKITAIVDTYISGNSAKAKHLSPQCWQRSNQFLRSLLDGYLSGDGRFEEKNNRGRLGLTQNLELEADFRTLCARLSLGLRIPPDPRQCFKKEHPVHCDEGRFERTNHPKDNGEIVAIGHSWVTKLWAITVDDESHRFALASGILSCNSNPMPNFRGVRFTNAHETLIWAQKKRGAKYTFNHHVMKALNDDLQMRSDWVLPLCRGKERIRLNGTRAHATQKPEALLYRVILSSTNPGDVVLDPFFGSGTTGAVAKALGRHWIGIEQDADYIRIAEERIAAVQPAPAEVLSFSEPRRLPRIPMGMLLETGLLHPGQALYFGVDGTTRATVLANGHVRCGALTGSVHQIARLLTGAPCNGWEQWYYEDARTGHRLPLDSLRKLLRSQREAKAAGMNNDPPSRF